MNTILSIQCLSDEQKTNKENKILKIMNDMNSLALDILSLRYFENIDITDHDVNEYNIIIEEKADNDLKKIIQEKNNNKFTFTLSLVVFFVDLFFILKS